MTTADDAKRITGAVLATLKAGGDNLAIYQAVLGAMPDRDALSADNDRLRGVLTIIAGSADKLQALQANAALDNIGAKL